MVHAEASKFATGASKAEVYEQVIQQTEALCDGQRNWVCNLANAASLLYHGFHSLPPPSSAVNWAGFYVLDPKKTSQLILGPFQGKVACQTIAFGKGVCGTAAERGEPVVVPDVEEFPGHIACDGDSQSEIVVPIVKNGKVVAIIDIDCAQREGFDDEDKDQLVKLAQVLSDASDW